MLRQAAYLRIFTQARLAHALHFTHGRLAFDIFQLNHEIFFVARSFHAMCADIALFFEHFTDILVEARIGHGHYRKLRLVGVP